ncbi:MAG: hypothetical protein V4689_20685 [Verrucomicrobiota bacterium]
MPPPRSVWIPLVVTTAGLGVFPFGKPLPAESGDCPDSLRSLKDVGTLIARLNGFVTNPNE